MLHTIKQITTSWVGCTKFFPQLSLFLRTPDHLHLYWCPWNVCFSVGVFHWFWESLPSAYLWQKLFSLQIWSPAVMEANYSVTCLLPALDHVYKPESCSNNSNKQPASCHASSIDFVWCQLSGLLTVSDLEALAAHAQSSSAAFLPCASRDCFALSLTKAVCKQRNGFHSALLHTLWSPGCVNESYFLWQGWKDNWVNLAWGLINSSVLIRYTKSAHNHPSWQAFLLWILDLYHT